MCRLSGLLLLGTLAAASAEPVKVTFVGDIMCQGAMMKAYRTKDKAGYDFTPVYRDIKPLLTESDYVIGNLETPIAPDNQDLTYKRWEFCSPIEFAKNMKDAGIDFVFTANNHCLDRGPAGVVRTIQALDMLGLPHTGTFATKDAAAQPVIVDVKGFKLGLLSYTYGSNAFSNNQYLNETNQWMVNFFQQQELTPPGSREWIYGDKNKPEAKAYEEWERTHCPDNFKLPVYERQEPHEAERAKIKVDVARMKAAKPDFTVMSMHTGGQYNPEATKYTKELTGFLFDCGVDIIVGSHEHVVHGTDLSGFATNRLAAYSLGNFNCLNGNFLPPMGKKAEYSVAWHLYLGRDRQGRPFVQKTTFTVLKCVRDGAFNHVRVVPAADLYAREQKPAVRSALRRDIMAVAKAFSGSDFDALGVMNEYPLMKARESEVQRHEAMMPVVVDAQIPAGNVIVEKIEGDVVCVRPDLRDTQDDWTDLLAVDGLK